MLGGTGGRRVKEVVKGAGSGWVHVREVDGVLEGRQGGAVRRRRDASVRRFPGGRNGTMDQRGPKMDDKIAPETRRNAPRGKLTHE